MKGRGAMVGNARQAVGGWLALAVTVMLWSSFALSARGIGESGLTVADAALLRFATPLLVLAPRLPATLRALRGERVGVVALLLAGGLPHFVVFAIGAHLTSAALTGMLVPGTVPLFVSLLAYAATRRSLRPRQVVALGLITSGVVISGLLVGGGSTLGGVGLLLTGGFAWSVYTMGLQRTSLTPLQMITTVCAASSLGCLLLAGTGVMPSALLHGSVHPQAVVLVVSLQGIGTGLLSTLCYALSVRMLGSGLASIGGAVSPVLTAVLAVPVFGESLSVGLEVALALIVAGVATSNLALPRPTSRTDHHLEGFGRLRRTAPVLPQHAEQ